MSTLKCQHLFENNPVIAGVRSPKQLKEAIDSPTEVIFLLCGSIYNLEMMVNHIKQAGKSAFVHLDLIKGYGQDSYFIKYLADDIHPAGVISTKNSLLQRAKQDGLMTIQRVFMLDSAALEVSLNAVRKVRPDAVEVLPGVVPKLITRVDEALNIPIITGGFIQTAEEVRAGLEAGALSCSTSDPELWSLNYRDRKSVV